MTNFIIIEKINGTLKKTKRKEEERYNKDNIKRISKGKWKESK